MVQEFTGGWYLRGDIGVGVQRFKEFDFVQTNSAFVWPASWRIDQREMGDAFFFGGGFGYQWNSWLRFDATAEYRAKTKFKAIGSYTEFCPGGRCFDAYDGNHSAFVLMANGYIDLGTWMCLTPFIGAGVGVARHSVTGFNDVGFISDGTTGFGYAANNDFSEWKFAWAVHAGVAYNVIEQFQGGARLPLPELRQRQHLDHRLRERRVLDGRRAARLLHLPRVRLAGHQARHALDAHSRRDAAADVSAAADAQRLILSEQTTSTARASPAPSSFLERAATRSAANPTLRLMPDDHRQCSIVL